jgi:spermidine dehydrogenase
MSRYVKNGQSDAVLGMDRAITRRDFLHGTALVAGGILTSATHATEGGEAVLAGAQDLPGYYPPRLTGLRGSHPGSFEVAHALRDGATWPDASVVEAPYDLIVVGAGISGLSAAHFYLERRPDARILLLDNHDDFGGHAKRNEFLLDGQVRLMNGGTLAIESPRPYGPVADGVLRAIGIDAPKLAKRVMHPEVYKKLGLREGVFFDRETFGADHLAVGYRQRPIRQLLAAAPLTPKARRDIARIEHGRTDYYAGLSSIEKKQRLKTISYRDYLRDTVRADPLAVAFYQSRTKGEWGVGIDAVSALDCWGLGLPGFAGLRLARGSIPGMGFTPAGYADTGGSVWLHFPDGNATVARGLVRRLIPAAVPGRSIDDLVSARVDYARLDHPDSAVRLRLSATVVGVRHVGDPATATSVEVTYVRGGRAFTARAAHSVLACYNMMIPELMPELPAVQKAALRELVKTPLVYTSVAIRNWQSLARLGVSDIHAPGGYHSSIRLNFTADTADYKSPRDPNEPNLLWLTRTPCKPGLTEHEQNRIGRAELMAASFEDIERSTRDQLARMLGSGGFDPATDITAITVNRWPHGYAPENNSLFDPDVEEALQPHVRGRTRFGRVTIANSDSGGGAYTDVAIEQAARAVSEIFGA